MSYGTVQAEKMTTESGYSLGAGNASSFKNRLINGDGAIDQRNAGASVSATNGSYTVDRWNTVSYDAGAQTGKFTVQQNAGSVTPPTGFKYYIGCTSSAATSVSSNGVYALTQYIEGLNVRDLAWGTASAKSITVSFWAYSSLTGNFGGAIQNSDGNYNYPFQYAISSANTWTYCSVTVPGPTAGTWLTTNGVGVILRFGLGAGTSWTEPAGAWSTSSAYSADSSVSVVSTSGAVLYLTGVQLEVGTVATSFDFRPYGTELALCRRYFTKYYQNTTGITGDSAVFNLSNWDGTSAYGAQWYQVSMRSAPSFSYSGLSDFTWYNASATKTPTAINQQGASVDRCEMNITWSGAISTGSAGWLRISGSGSGGWVSWSAEL